MTTKPARAVDLPLAHLYEDGVFYPDEDGVPLPDGYTQSPLMYDAVAPLNAHFAGRPNTAVSGNTFIYYERSNPQRSISPDCYVAFDVDVAIILYHNTYRVWAVGKPPDFALEIASESTAGRDLNAKRVLYAKSASANTGATTLRMTANFMASRWSGNIWSTAHTSVCRWPLTPKDARAATAQCWAWIWCGTTAGCVFTTRRRANGCGAMTRNAPRAKPPKQRGKKPMPARKPPKPKSANSASNCADCRNRSNLYGHCPLPRTPFED